MKEKKKGDTNKQEKRIEGKQEQVRIMNTGNVEGKITSLQARIVIEREIGDQ